MSFQSLFEKHRNRVEKELKAKKRSGIPLNRFYALMNIAKEIRPLNMTRTAEDIWYNYAAFIDMADEIRENPQLFDYWDEVVGEEYVHQTLMEGGAFLTWHYGFVRHNVEPIILALLTRTCYPQLPLYQVVDQESIVRERGLEQWKAKRDWARLQLLNSQSKMIGLTLHSHLRRGGSFCLFLDGQTGYNEDNYDLNVRWITSIIKTRSGIYRIISKSKKKICLSIMSLTDDYRSIIQFFPPISVSESIQETCSELHALFRQRLQERPEWWRLWSKHHHQVIKWGDEMGEHREGRTHRETDLSQPNYVYLHTDGEEWISEPVPGFGRLALNARNGKLYKLTAEANGRMP